MTETYSDNVWLNVAAGIPVTLQITIVGFLVGAILGVPLMAMRNSKHSWLRWPARAYIELWRGIPPIVWLFLIFNGLPDLNPRLIEILTPMFSAFLGFGLISAAYMAEIYRGCLSAVHKGQDEAASALGMSRRDIALQIIYPQMLRISIPAAATYAIGLLKDSSIAYTIGCLDIMYQANNMAAGGTSLMPLFVGGVFYILMTFPAAWLARTVDAKLRKKVAR